MRMSRRLWRGGAAGAVQQVDEGAVRAGGAQELLAGQARGGAIRAGVSERDLTDEAMRREVKTLMP